MIANASKLLMELARNEDGQDLIEYALVAGLIGMGAVISLTNVSTKLHGAFNVIGSNLSNAT
jgi:pilus assembly protein Flp/PilA